MTPVKAHAPCWRHDSYYGGHSDSSPRPHDTSVVRVNGSLRVPLRSGLREVLEARIRCGARRLVLDISAVHEIDAAGIGQLVDLFNLVTAAGGVLAIAHPNGHVRRVLQMTRVLALFATPIEFSPRDTVRHDAH